MKDVPCWERAQLHSDVLVLGVRALAINRGALLFGMLQRPNPSTPQHVGARRRSRRRSGLANDSRRDEAKRGQVDLILIDPIDEPRGNWRSNVVRYQLAQLLAFRNRVLKSGPGPIKASGRTGWPAPEADAGVRWGNVVTRAAAS